MRVLHVMLVVAAVCSGATPLRQRIQSVLQASPEARQSFWGIRVIDAGSGAVLYSLNAEKFFVPASNTKLFTTALALTRLGPDYRFRTIVQSDAVPDIDGRIRELRLIGGGDPNLSGRVLPYKHDAEPTNPLAAIEAMADQIVASGVRIIDGDVVGDDTAYEWDPYPNGWAVDDPVWEYGAPVSALTLNDNSFKLAIEPGPEIGTPAALSLAPSLEYFTIHNQTRTVIANPARITVDRLPGSRELIIRGEITQTSAGRSLLVAVDDPALFAASALRDALLARGVKIQGEIRTIHRSPGEEIPALPGVELARHTSAPLSQILQVINKVSQNLHTELLLREIARLKDGIGTRKAGLEEIAAFLKEIGVEDKQHNFEDASGLSRLTLVTPSAISKLLLFMYGTPHRDLWIATLPIGGQDGTLNRRFAGAPLGENIRAKTGSISHVSSLSGYALRKNGRTYVFSIVTNNYNAESAAVRKIIDRIALALLR